jgi:Methyltransferase domain
MWSRSSGIAFSRTAIKPFPNRSTSLKTYSTEFDRRGAPSKKLRQVAAYWRWEGRPVPDPIDLKAMKKNLPPNATVMEVGPGDGHVLPFLQDLAREGKIGKVIVVDQNGEVISELSDEFRYPFHFTRGDRPNLATKEPASLDYVRATRVVPYLNDAQLEQFFTDVGPLLKRGGSLFITAYHASQTPVFRTHSLEQVIVIAGKGCLKPDQLEVAFSKPGQYHEPLEVHQFSVADVTPEELREHDKAIKATAERWACHAGDIEVEMRLLFVFGDVETSVRPTLAQE